ncbi:MAG: phospho-N-acetylmuramoyl-pentapeptide-transferase, partial [Chitinophagales bacterium]
MLKYLFELFESLGLPGADTFLRLMGYVSFKAAAAIVISLVISMVFGGRLIRGLQRLQVKDEERKLGLPGEAKKQGTPTMGGLIILTAILVPVLLIADLTNIYILLMIMTTVWMGAVGFADDYIKVFRKNKA